MPDLHEEQWGQHVEQWSPPEDPQQWPPPTLQEQVQRQEEPPLERTKSLEELRSHCVPFHVNQPSAEEMNKAAWERGQPDYMGVNAWENIMQKLDTVVHGEEYVQKQQEDKEKYTQESHNEETPVREQHTVNNENTHEKAVTENQNVEEKQENIQAKLEEEENRRNRLEGPIPEDNFGDWQSGRPDYLGKASFDYILRRIEATTGPMKRPTTTAKLLTSRKFKKPTKEELERERQEELAAQKEEEERQLSNGKDTVKENGCEEEETEIEPEKSKVVDESTQTPSPQVWIMMSDPSHRRVLGRGRARKNPNY